MSGFDDDLSELPQTPDGAHESAPQPAEPRPPESADAEAPPSALVFIKDNLEALAVAVVMALVIKHFCVEAFKIPTGSMMPTLYGDNHDPSRDGDRILVDKWSYLFSEPDRWDIPVFRYPLDRSRNFIKRIAGLPGEHLRIHEGDIWTKPAGSDAPFRIARKGDRVRDSLFFPVYPPYVDEGEGGDDAEVRDALDRTWRMEGPEGAWRLHDHAHYEFLGGPQATLVTKESIHGDSNDHDWPRSYYSDDPVRDIRVRATIERGPPAPAGLGSDAPNEVVLTWKPDGVFEAVVVLSARQGGSHAELSRDGRVLDHCPLDVSPGPKSSTSVTLEYVDGDFRVWIGDVERCVIADGRRIDEGTGRSGQALSVRAVGSPWSVKDLRIDRDLYYENRFSYRGDWQRDGLVIPEGAYFMLGDNTDHSSDSRKWRVRTVFLRDGTEIRYDDGGSGHGPSWLDGGMKQVVDVDGVTRTWHEDDEDPDRGGTAENAPFVWRELIVGRAFLVFWPLTPDFPGRLRFIH